MCAVFNLMLDIEPERDKAVAAPPSIGKRTVKTSNALRRAVLVTALHFVEAYLNGLAFDHLARNATSLDEKTKALLSERREGGTGRKYLSLREKALKYPRIVMGLDHPP
jgi:hypothetical protein